MEVARGEVWWVGTRPVLIVQSKAFNRSRIQTVTTAVITGNLALANAPGNVEIGPRESGLRKASVVIVSQLFTVDRDALRSRAGRLTSDSMDAVSDGLRLALEL